MNLIPKILLALTAAISAAAAVATLVSLPLQADRFRLSWGVDTYVWTTLPYVALLILAAAFRKTVPGAMISLIGALMIGGFGVFATYNTRDAMGIGLAPFVLFAGCGVVLLVQLVRWARMRHTNRRS